MHPVMLGQFAQDHVRSLIDRAEAARLAHEAACSRPSPAVRRRIGLRLIAVGNRLAAEPPHNVFHIHGGRV